MGFQKGQSGNLKGRPRRVDRIKQEIKDLCLALFDDAYWRRVKRELRKGTLNPRLEITLLAYAFGPSDKDDTTPGVTVNVGFLTAGSAPPRAALPPVDAETLPLSQTTDIDLTPEPVLVPEPVVPPES